jgi:hypothetical protein
VEIARLAKLKEQGECPIIFWIGINKKTKKRLIHVILSSLEANGLE